MDIQPMGLSLSHILLVCHSPQVCCSVLTNMSVPRISTLLVSRSLRLGLAKSSLVGPQVSEGAFRGLSTSSSLLDKFFTKKHEWVLVEGTKGTVGVSQYAADALGDIVYAQLPDPGDSVTAGEECGALESVKAASEVYSPVSGSVTEKNETVEDGPALINQSPQQDGWLFRLDLSDPSQVNELMVEEDYLKYLETVEDDH